MINYNYRFNPFSSRLKQFPLRARDRFWFEHAPIRKDKRKQSCNWAYGFRLKRLAKWLQEGNGLFKFKRRFYYK